MGFTNRGKKEFKRKLSRLTKAQIIFIFLGLIGIFLILVPRYVAYRQRILSFTKVPSPAITEKEGYSKPVRIQIPSIDVNEKVEEGQIVNGVWQISQENASYLLTSSRPGEGGNVVIYGHNKGSIFGPLLTARKGDIIKVETETGSAFEYQIEEVLNVKPDQIEVVLPTEDEVLTVYTCTGFLDTSRLIIKAKPYVETKI